MNKIDILHPENDLTTDFYPRILEECLPQELINKINNKAEASALSNYVLKTELATAKVEEANQTKYLYDANSQYQQGITYDSVEANEFSDLGGDKLAMIDFDGNLKKVSKNLVFPQPALLKRNVNNLVKHHIEINGESIIISFDLYNENQNAINKNEILKLNDEITASGAFRTTEGYIVIISEIKVDVNGIYLSGMKINGGIVKDYLLDSSKLNIVDRVVI